MNTEFGHFFSFLKNWTKCREDSTFQLSYSHTFILSTVRVTNNAWKLTSWKIIKNSCCKNNLCEYLVRALIVFPSRSWSFPFIIVLPIWEGDSFLVCTSPSLLWLQLFVRYYACTNQGHNFLVREEFTVCMWELHRKRKTMHDSWCSRTNFHCGNTYTHGKWITYLLWSVFVLLSMQVSW